MRLQKKSLDPNRIRFLFDGNRINDTDTPSALGIEEGDHIVSLNCFSYYD